MKLQAASVKTNDQVHLCKTWALDNRKEIKKAQGKLKGVPVAKAVTVAQHPKGNVEGGISLQQRKVDVKKPERLLKRAVKNFDNALKNVKKEARRKDVTSESMKAVLSKHTINPNEIADIFHNMPTKLLQKPAVGQAFYQIAIESQPKGPVPELVKLAGTEPQETKFKDVHEATTPKPIERKPEREAPSAFNAEFQKQKQKSPESVSDIDEVSDYMANLKSAGASEKLLLELARSFPDYKNAGWDTEQFMELCYQAQLAVHEDRADNPATAIQEAYRQLQ